jgi:hypothetical protein
VTADETSYRTPPPPAIDCQVRGKAMGKAATHYMPNGGTVLCGRCWRKAGRPAARWLASRATCARLLGLWPPDRTQDRQRNGSDDMTTTTIPSEPKLANRCTECGRPLRVLASRLRHTGPVCAAWLERQRPHDVHHDTQPNERTSP